MTIVPVSNWMKNEIQHSFLKNYSNQVIYNGIDTNIFKIYDSITIRNRYAINNKKIILGVASIWSEEKGLNDFIKLASIIDLNYIIILVGITPKQNILLPKNIIGITRTENLYQLAELYSAVKSEKTYSVFGR